MAYVNFMNIEVLALEIADEHINKMTEYNRYTDENGMDWGCDIEALRHNLKNGWIAVLMLSSYVESVINTILRDCVNYSGERLLKISLEDKIEILYLYFKIDMSSLKNENSWNIFKKINHLRNELVYYKLYLNHIPPCGGFQSPSFTA